VSSKKVSPVRRTVALCYIRQSLTRKLRDDTNPDQVKTYLDMDSPERQHDNIERLCQEKGWTPEWYQDTEGHKSGTKEHNRPGWLALQERLKAPDIVAVVANDLARLHRKGWRIGRLVDMLEELGVFLVLAAPGRELDLSKPQDRIAIQIIAMVDEWYAIDARLRLIDSVRHRHRKGITVGMPPFGTWRDEDGYLIPSPNGAWLLPDGTHVAGKVGEEPPQPAATWRGYFACAEQMLTLYALNKYGQDRTARKMNEEGWAFRDRNGQPRPIGKEDVRRVVSNWREYAGLVSGGRAKDKFAARIEDPLTALQNTGHNVMPIELVRQVAQVQLERSYTTNRVSPKKEADDYLLSGVLFCAHCAQDAREKQNPKLRVPLTGHRSNSTVPRYRHKEGYPCRAKNRSVTRKEVEADFGRLLGLLTIDESKIPLLVELKALSKREDIRDPNAPDPEEEKRIAIAKCRKRIDNAKTLCMAGDLDADEYLRIKEQNDQEIAHWEARTDELEQAALEFAMCVQTIQKLRLLWEISPDEDKQGMVGMLFEYVEYDLDTHRIVDFRLKPWADNFLIVRTALYEKENPRVSGDGKDGESDGSEPLSDTTVFRPRRDSNPRHSV
jgi:DNA invertase Pin-like site-specific DNA recombinase